MLVLRMRFRKAATWALLFSPVVLAPGLSAVHASYGYLAGTARIAFWGLPGSEWQNLDPEWRTFRASLGCIYSPTFDFFIDQPNNITVKALISIAGPMRGAYTGPYPLREEVARAIKTQGVEAPATTLRDGYVVAGTQRYRVRRSELTDEMLKSATIRVAVIESRVLVIEARVLETETAQLLGDLRTGRPFAAYYSDRVGGRFRGTSFEYKCRWGQYRCIPVYDDGPISALK